MSVARVNVPSDLFRGTRAGRSHCSSSGRPEGLQGHEEETGLPSAPPAGEKGQEFMPASGSPRPGLALLVAGVTGHVRPGAPLSDSGGAGLMARPSRCALSSFLLMYELCFGLLPEAPGEKVIKCYFPRQWLWVPAESTQLCDPYSLPLLLKSYLCPHSLLLPVTVAPGDGPRRSRMFLGSLQLRTLVTVALIPHHCYSSPPAVKGLDLGASRWRSG